MLKKGFVLSLIIIFQIIFVTILRAQDESTKPDDKGLVAEEKKETADNGIKPDVNEKVKQEIRGKITEIAEDKTYIKIGGAKVITTKQFLNDSFVAVGDNVAIMAEEIPGGVKALDFKYIYEESNDSSALDEDLITPGEFDKDISGE